MRQQQIVKRTTRTGQDPDLRTPTGRALPFSPTLQERITVSSNAAHIAVDLIRLHQDQLRREVGLSRRRRRHGRGRSS